MKAGITTTGMLLLVLLLALPGIGQDKTPKADSNDVNSVQDIVNAWYNSLHGSAGERDWDRLRSLFLPTARIDAINYNKVGRQLPRYGSVEDYITNSKDFFTRSDYFPNEVINKIEYYGHSAQVFSSYYATAYYSGSNKPMYFNGVACFQLMYYDNRWWISNLIWNLEKPGIPVPTQLK